MVPNDKKKERPSERAIRLLNERLADDNCTEGTRLPSERTLANELGISRRALREALGQFEAEGKIWRGVGQGTFVGHRPLNPRADLAALQDLTSPSEIIEARLALEPPIASLAAIHATSSDLQKAWHCLKKSAGVSGAQAWELWDGALHNAIATAANNTLISALFNMLNSARAQTDWGRLRQASLTPENQKHYTAQHRNILIAISNRNSAQAAQAMQTHLFTVKETLLISWDYVPAVTKKES